MNQYIIEIFLGLICGIFSGVTGILLLIIFDYFKIGDYRSNLGAIAFLNLFPISIGSFYEFFKSGDVNFSMGIILLISIILGGYIGTKFILNEKIKISKQLIKYITSFLGFTIGFLFLVSAYFETN